MLMIIILLAINFLISLYANKLLIDKSSMIVYNYNALKKVITPLEYSVSIKVLEKPFKANKSIWMHIPILNVLLCLNLIYQISFYKQILNQ